MSIHLINQQIKENQEFLTKTLNENPDIRDYYCTINVTIHFFDVTEETSFILKYIECLNLDYYKFYTGSSKVRIFDTYVKNTIYEFKKSYPDSLMTDITINIKPAGNLSMFSGFNLLQDRRSSLQGVANIYLKSLV